VFDPGQHVVDSPAGLRGGAGLLEPLQLGGDQLGAIGVAGLDCLGVLLAEPGLEAIAHVFTRLACLARSHPVVVVVVEPSAQQVGIVVIGDRVQ
jgi:hypothetical protein